MGTNAGAFLKAAPWLALSAATLGIVLLLQACFSQPSSPPPPPSTPPPPAQRLSGSSALAPFFTALNALEQRQTQRPLRIIQIGDSHTANDSLSGHLRELFQARFGNSGRGWLPAGIPFKYYRPHLVDVSEDHWRHFKPNDHEPVAFGLDANDAASDPRDAVMAIEGTEPGGFDQFGVEFLTQPNGSAFTVQVDDASPARVSTAAAQPAISRFELPLDRPSRRVELRATGKPPVVLLGWTIEQHHPGVIYENHGTIGATVDLLGQMTPEAVAYELSVRQPSLLVVAFGTNEGFADNLDLDRYAARFQDQIAALRRRAPGIPLLILGAPDGNRVAKNCNPAAPCGSAPGDCTWQEPPKLAGVRELQHRVAADNGWAYWDWFGAMGGTCSIDRMTNADPALAMPDHVHLSRAGYEGIGDALFGDLMNAYADWKARGPAS